MLPATASTAARRLRTLTRSLTTSPATMPRFVRPLSLLALLVTLLLAVTWCVAPPSLQVYLLYLVRPDVSLGEVGIATALGLHIFFPDRPRARLAHRIAAAAGLGVGGVHLGACLLQRNFSFVALINPALPETHIRMAPLVGGVLIVAAISALLFSRPAGSRTDRLAVSTSLFVILMCTGFLASSVFHWVSLQSPSYRRFMLPGATTTLLSMSLCFLLSRPQAVVVREFTGRHPSAFIARRLLTYSAACVLLFGLSNIALHRIGALSVQESTAMLSCFAATMLVALLHSHARIVRKLFDEKSQHLRMLQDALQERRALNKVIEEDRSRMRGIFEAATGHSIIATDTDGIIVMFSNGAERMTGLKADDVVGKLPQLALHDPKELQERARQLGVAPSFDVFRAVPNLQQCDQREWTYLGAEGRRVPVWLSVTSTRDPSNTINGYLSIGRDISVDKRIRSERDAFLAIGQELLCVSDPATGVFQSVSPAFDRLFGYRPVDLVGRSFMDFVHPADRESTADVVVKLIDGVRISRFENRWRGCDGRYRWVSWDASVPYDDGLVYASGWDVTQEKARMLEVEELLTSEQHLIGIVSHDLRNPISAVAMGAQALLRHKDNPERIERIAHRIAGSCEKAERLIHNMLDFTQARSGRGLSVQLAQMDLVDVTARTVEEVQAAHPERRIQLCASSNVPIVGDKDRIGQVVGNLLSNACKYSSAQGFVRVTIEHDASDVILKVHNDGDPIPPEVMPYLFKPYRRGTHTGHKQRNVGLGLFIVREIVARHGGTVDVESAPTLGTTVRIILPDAQLASDVATSSAPRHSAFSSRA